jgi:GNAT superfamily N-acetyltransferase
VVVEVRPVRAGEAPALREFRLRALADAPTAFASSVELEAAHPDSHWNELVAAATIFVAEQDRAWVGMAAGRWYDREQGVAQLWGMWVDPVIRRSGVGARLVAAVDRWAAEQGARLVRLGVIDGAPDVEAFYVRLGFSRTGETRPLTRDETRTALFLARPVSAA